MIGRIQPRFNLIIVEVKCNYKFMNFLFSQDNCESQTFHFKGFPNMLSCEMVTCALSGQAPAQIVFLTSLPLRWYTHLLKGKDLIHVIPSEPKQC